MNLLRTLSVFLFVSSILIGCKSSPDDVRIPVQGKVMIGDQAANNGTVILKPDAGKGNASKHEPRGTIGSDGSYTIETTTQKGAPEGWYMVGVIVMAGPPDLKNPYAEQKWLTPKEYSTPETSGLFLKVEKTPPAGAYDIKVDLKVK